MTLLARIYNLSRLVNCPDLGRDFYFPKFPGFPIPYYFYSEKTNTHFIRMKKIAIPFFLLFLLLFAFSQCQKSNAPIDVSGCNFYFWKTRLSFNDADKALADSLGVERLYLRYFEQTKTQL